MQPTWSIRVELKLCCVFSKVRWFSKGPLKQLFSFLGPKDSFIQDKVRMLGALVLCSPSEHIFHCTLLTLQCGYVNEWNALREASEEPCSVVPQRPHTAYGRNLSGVYTDLPMPRGTQHLLQEPTRNGQSVWTELSFLGQTFWSLWPFHNSLGIRSTT